ncbi:MAG: thioredoxin family protein [Dialister sp.]|nr:thioredoxin family protein [Dialister sp.]
MMIEDIHSAQDMDRLVAEGEGYVLLWLWAAWCRPCQVMAPAVQALEERAEGFGLVGVPTFILYKDGEETGRIIGYRMKAKFFEELEAMMK